MIKIRKTLLPILLSFIFVSSVAAWDDAGHKLTAYIAWRQMSAEARNEAFRILMKAPEDSDLSVFYNAYESRAENVKKRELFMIAATWSDIIKNRNFPNRFEKYNRGDWHYADIFWRQTNGKASILENFADDGGKAILKLYDFEKTLKNPLATDFDKAIALAWFLHVGGDIHNPLHNASRVTEIEPKGDQGGNLFILSARDAPREDRVNLHYFWDSLITRNFPRTNDACDADYIGAIAEKITEKYPYSKMKDRLKLGDFEAWHREGFAFLNTDVYTSDLERNKMPTKRYRENSLKLGEAQLALAGYRLGETLNRIFGNNGLMKSDENNFKDVR